VEVLRARSAPWRPAREPDPVPRGMFYGRSRDQGRRPAGEGAGEIRRVLLSSEPAALLRASALEALYLFLEPRDDRHDRAVEDPGARQTIGPILSRVEGRKIPERAPVAATFGLPLGGIGLPPKLVRNPMVVVPEVAHARVFEPPKNDRAGLRHVGEKDRFPDSHHPDVCPGMALQDFIHCGGPPQTRRSRRGKEKDEPRCGTGPIELGFEIRDGRFIDDREG
jgi:hypothetical protein